MKNLKTIGYLICLTFFLSSCEKVIELNVNSSADKLVVEAILTDQNVIQKVTLSRSVPYTNTNIYPAVTGAELKLNDDQGNSWILNETSPGRYTFGPMKAETGRKYTLQIKTGGTTYTASSTLQPKVAIDALNIKRSTIAGSERLQLEVDYSDPANQTNQYRWIMKVNGALSKSIYVDNDRLNNGKAISKLLFYNGNDDEELKQGDFIELEMQCIDSTIFTYWYTLSQQSQNGIGGGTVPGNPPSNFDNGALGYFSVHTVELKTITVN